MLLNIYSFVKKFWARILIIGMGLGSLIWFLIRVIPKPSRAGYPCMKATIPLASSFITYILGITSFTFLFRKAREKVFQSKIILTISLGIIGLSLGLVTIFSNQSPILAADYQDPQTSNEPIGIGKGVVPGRVVWIHNENATNENCPNSDDNYWYMDGNTSQAVVNEMLSEGLQGLTRKSTDNEAWDALFTYFNENQGKGSVGYSSGEKIVIKLNMNGVWNGDAAINTSPHLTYAILNQLINVVGVAESDISIGDPNCSMISGTYEKCYPDFPLVTYWRANGASAPEGTSSTVVHGSDGSFDNRIPKAYEDAAYLINIPVFKKHHRAGISISSKNHFGSIAPYSGGAAHLHYALPVPDAHEEGTDPNGEYGVYRCLVDLMGHKDLGGKTLLHIVDGLWGSTNWGHPPILWKMAPFNGDYPNSLFLSQDPVAIQSVCYDFLYEEFDLDRAEGDEGLPATTSKGPFSRFKGTDDFLHQAADPSNWPTGLDYDPEDDGSILTSLGVHEHWNNATDKQYTRNMGTGEGIELVGTYAPTGLQDNPLIAEGYKLLPNYPNPFTESTTLGFHLAAPSQVSLNIFNSAGELVQQINYTERMVGDYEYTWNAGDIAPGQYVYSVAVQNEKGSFNLSGNIMKLK